MLLAIEVTLNLIWIAVACLAFGIAGFITKSSKAAGLKNKIQKLEKEMLENHAEILSLQRENVHLQHVINAETVPVIPISSKEIAEPGTDGNPRKKTQTGK